MFLLSIKAFVKPSPPSVHLRVLIDHCDTFLLILLNDALSHRQEDRRKRRTSDKHAWKCRKTL